jgi:phasin
MNTKTPSFEIPAEMREMAERSVDQARKAMDGFVGAAVKAMESFDTPSMGGNAKELRQKTFSFAEQNLQAAFDHAQKLVRAKDPTEAMRLQAEFMQNQFAAMQKQIAEFGAAAQATMTEATKSGQPKK